MTTFRQIKSCRRFGGDWFFQVQLSRLWVP